MSIYNHLYIHVKKKKQKKRLTATQQQQQMWQQGPHGPMHHQSFTTQVTGCHHADDSVYHAGTPHHAGEYTTSQVGTVITQMTGYHAGTPHHAGEYHLAGGNSHHADDSVPRRYRSPRRGVPPRRWKPSSHR